MDTPSTDTPKIEFEPGLETPKLRLAGASEAAGPVGVSPERRLEEQERLLEEARQVLVALKVDRSRIEARLAELGREDPIEVTRGRSALDKAILECQEVIERLDHLVLATRNR